MRGSTPLRGPGGETRSDQDEAGYDERWRAIKGEHAHTQEVHSIYGRKGAMLRREKVVEAVETKGAMANHPLL
jgi:hypothetical protein